MTRLGHSLALVSDLFVRIDVSVEIDAFAGSLRERLGIDLGDSRSRRDISQLIGIRLVVFTRNAASPQELQELVRDLHSDRGSNF